jgi:hypothetical protein
MTRAGYRISVVQEALWWGRWSDSYGQSVICGGVSLWYIFNREHVIRRLWLHPSLVLQYLNFIILVLYSVITVKKILHMDGHSVSYEHKSQPDLLTREWFLRDCSPSERSFIIHSFNLLQWLYSPFLGLGLFFSFVILFYTVGRAPWTADQPLPTHRTTQTQNKRTHRHPCLEWDSNPWSHHSSGRRHFMSYTARPPW